MIILCGSGWCLDDSLFCRGTLSEALLYFLFHFPNCKDFIQLREDEFNNLIYVRRFTPSSAKRFIKSAKS